VITAVLNFVIVAAVVYFVIVVPLNRLERRTARHDEPTDPPEPTDVELLTEIRDLLRDQQR
jgi:large conductance mechanosensitive channel